MLLPFAHGRGVFGVVLKGRVMQIGSLGDVVFEASADGRVMTPTEFLRALAAGWTEPNESGGHRIHVQRMAVFAHDLFNFEGEASLGFWSCKKKDFSIVSPDILVPENAYSKLENRDFRQFAASRGRGGDFQVLSKPHIVEFFREVAYDFS